MDIIEKINNLVQSLIHFRIPTFTLELDKHDYWLWRKQSGYIDICYPLRPDFTKGTLMTSKLLPSNENSFKIGRLTIIEKDKHENSTI